MSAPQRYSVVVAKDYLKFAAAHFIAYPGFREPLHGHNYQVSVRVEADLGADGYVLDFGLVKRVARALCEEPTSACSPAASDCLTIAVDGARVEVTTAEGDRFSSCSDCAVLPIVHSPPKSSPPICWRVRERLAAEAGGRGLVALEVVAERPQVAYCRETWKHVVAGPARRGCGGQLPAEVRGSAGVRAALRRMPSAVRPAVDEGR